MKKQLSVEHLIECKKIIKEGSKSFYIASLMLPKKVRMAAFALYAFCRISDDIADEPEATLQAVAHLKERLENAYAGTPYDHPADKAFSEVVTLYDIPKAVPLAMIEGFEWDVSGKQYNTISDVIDYSARVAGTIGIMMSVVMGRRVAPTLARACDLGVAMQLINISRDVGEDARNGRVYLPKDWLAEEGIEQADLIANPVYSDALGRVVERTLALAEEIYLRGVTGIVELPTSCRPGIRAAGLVYAEIGEMVKQNGYNSVDQRAFTTKERKIGLMFKSFGNPMDMNTCDPSPALPEVQFLIDATKRESDEAFNEGEWLINMWCDMKMRDKAFLDEAKEAAKIRSGPLAH